MKFCLLLVPILLTTTANASTLTTKNYTITIETHCEEGSVSCDNVTYVGTSHRSGNSITLQGTTWHTLCADGVTPCRFLGYQFRNANIEYHVFESGLLQVIQQGNTTLIEEQGTWSY